MTTTITGSGQTTNTAANTSTKTNTTGAAKGTGSQTAEEAKTASATKGLGDNFETFLKMLTTQMKNQDPLKPMDTNEMTKQLVEFANVEQNIGTNSRLDKLLKLQGASTASTNLAYLGRMISYEGDQFDYAQGMTQAPLGYELETAAKSVRVDILDSAGRKVRSFPGEKTAGTKHIVNWDFKDDNGLPVPPGSYRLNIAPTGEKEDQIIKAKTYTFGTVAGVSQTKDGETTLTVGSTEVPLSKIMTVH
ncbi:flagellar hook assembly protein FlgD [Azospirillum thermophilum]|uniref:Basal-body rod modification protein FlgD n=1 Tax=Azospirillum thermophilum TaxID=2202148 RepID=A0A2S2CQU4_9PROT|nr:flagellar hook capping FlgD N-terminal domain-containing protein [Azospirillum thermophilum]AWK86795.1 flagellar biosynthesis protein FlgD [Azospirillum thermophilum]